MLIIMTNKTESILKLETKKPITQISSDDTDKMERAIGSFGRWQIILCAIVAFPTRISAAWQQLGIVFIAPSTTFQCSETNLTDIIQPSTCYSDCVKYHYFTEFENTIISEWDLICERAWMANFTQTMCMFGVLVGSIISGFIADRYGRRTASLTSYLLLLVTTFIEPFSTSYWMFSITRFFIGFFTAGTLMCSFIILMEITGPKKRELMNWLCATPYLIGQLLMPLFAYYLRSWNRFSLGIAIPNILSLVYFFALPESPRWLISVGRLEEASKVMTQAARWNNRPSDNMLDVVKSIGSDSVNSKDCNQGRATYLDLVGTRALTINTVCSCVIWFIVGVGYFGSYQYIGQSSSNAFVTVALAGALQIPGISLTTILCKYVGRKITLIGSLTVSAICNACLAVPEDWFYVRLMMGTIGISASAGAFTTLYMYTTELFPTVTRNMALGASSTVSRVGSMLAPYVAGLAGFAAWLPPAAFAITPVLGAVICLFLPETRGKTLLDHVA